MTLPIVILIIYGVLLIVVGAYYRAGTSGDFHIASRRVGAVRFLASIFTVIGVGEPVTLTALAYVFGLWALSFFGGAVIGFMCLAFLAHRALSRSVENDFQSLPDYFFFHFGRAASVFATSLNVVALGALLLIQFLVGGLLLNTVTGLPVWISILSMAVVVGLYVWLGGFRSVLATDVIQGTVMMALVVILFVTLSFVGIAEPAEAAPVLNAIPLADGLSLIVLGFFAVLGAADVWQRVFSARDDTAARRGLLLSAAAWASSVVLGGSPSLGLKLFRLAAASISVPSTVKCSSDSRLRRSASSTTWSNKACPLRSTDWPHPGERKKSGTHYRCYWEAGRSALGANLYL